MRSDMIVLCVWVSQHHTLAAAAAADDDDDDDVQWRHFSQSLGES